MNEARYFCRNCGQEVKDTDQICPNCERNLREVGRNITLVLTGQMALTGSLSADLTEAERSTLHKMFSFVKQRVNELEFKELSIGFPSGIKFTFVKREDKKGNSNL